MLESPGDTVLEIRLTRAGGSRALEVSGSERFHGFAVCLMNGLPDRIRPWEPSPGGPALGVPVVLRVLIFDMVVLSCSFASVS
jgi:hypothetical protein